MAIGAARVMAAGKAGLESLPIFVDELMAQGIPQLAPWAIDHSQDQIDELRAMTWERVKGSWQSLFGIGVSAPGITMDADTAPNRRLLLLENPLAAEATELADSPAQLGVWCRRQLGAICRDTENIWEHYKAVNGLTSSYQLAVVIPYCPEGPTSGTVGMYLGAALREHFKNEGKSDELVVWGVELCPPIGSGGSGGMDRLAVQNAFRGYVARQELIAGVPLSEQENDTKRHQCFDINIVFDGGTARLPTASGPEVIWQAIDRAAAQVTACLLNGAGGGDKPEATVQLKQGQRWNAHLAHVVSELSYEHASRYLTYQVTLPWHRDPEAWENASVVVRKDALLYRIDNDIKPRLQYEQNAIVKKHFQDLAGQTDKMAGIDIKGKWNNLLTRNREKALEELKGLLERAVHDDQLNYLEVRTDPERIIARSDLFCINLVLPEEQRHQAALIQRDNGIPGPIADVLGDAGVTDVRGRLTTLCREVLTRKDCDPVEADSEAFYHEVMSISVADGSRDSNNGFRPSREFLNYFIAADRRGVPGAFSELFFDLNKVIPRQQSGDDRPTQPATLMWRLSDGDYDVPVEYSILTLARVNSDDGFKDISTYQELKENYDKLTGDREGWREYARYYGIKPPPELLPNETPRSPVAEPGVNGQPARTFVAGGTA